MKSAPVLILYRDLWPLSQGTEPPQARDCRRLLSPREGAPTQQARTQPGLHHEEGKLTRCCLYFFFKLKSSWFIGLPWSQLVKNPPAMWETWVRSLGWEDPWGQGSPLQYSGLENSKDCIVHGVAKSRKRLRDWATALIHNVMLVSGIQQSDSNINISIPFFCSFFIMGYCYAI